MKGLLLNYQYGMWDAVISGRKTNTRRAHKSLHEVNQNPDEFEILICTTYDNGEFTASFKPKNGGKIIECRSRYKVGEVTFLQEPTLNLKPHVTDQDTIMYQYRDKDGQTELNAFKELIQAATDKGAKWTNKMFMPQAEARYFVKITKIEIQRLNDISEGDCIKEGIEKQGDQYFFKTTRGNNFFTDPKKAYFGLYNLINKGAAPNPWVFSYHFELCSANG